MARFALFLILSFLSWHSTADLEASYSNRITFAELQINPEKYDGKNVDVIGVLSVQGGEVFLCESMDVCLSWNPFRLKIDFDSISKSTLNNVNAYDTCPVIIIANFNYEPHHQSHVIGELNADPMVVELSVSRKDYQDFNKKCVIWNDYIKGFEKRYGEKKDDYIKEIIEIMRARTR